MALPIARGCSLKENPRTPPKKIRKNPQKIKDFFEDLLIRLPYLGVNNSSN